MMFCIVSLMMAISSTEDQPTTVDVPMHLLEPDNSGALHLREQPPLLQFADAYGEYSLIAPPEPGQDREAWLTSLTKYRDNLRNGLLQAPILRFSYTGERAWVRFSNQLAKALGLVPDDELTVTLDARWISGNPRVGIAFDIHDSASDNKTGWTGVVATTELPRDGEWHRIHLMSQIPHFTPASQWLRPIIGYDATEDPAPGQIEVRSVALNLPSSEKAEVITLTTSSQSSLPQPDFSTYDRPDLQWVSRSFTCRFTFMYDSAFYDHKKGEYTVESYLDEGEREFGGYDAVLLWHAYPRIGLDDRNQFDFYRDMPGGLEGVRDVVRRLHARGVKAYINYNPWDRATRREGVSDEQLLADMVAKLEVDGIFLDTMLASSPELRQKVDEYRPGVAFIPEGHPKSTDIDELVGSWAQFAPNPFSPAILHHKWIEPRHVEYQIRRWNTLVPGTDHAEEIENAFFNGSGMMIWENIFGTTNLWRAEDRASWRRAANILRTFSDHFIDSAWDPFYPTSSEKLYAHRWPMEKTTLFTLVNKGEPMIDASLLQLPWTEKTIYFDLWTGQPLNVQQKEDTAVVIGSVSSLGCVLAVHGDNPPGLDGLLEQQRAEVERGLTVTHPRKNIVSVVLPEPVKQTRAQSRDHVPEGMVYIPAARRTFHIEHVRRECGCYPDPGTPEDEHLASLQGWEWYLPMNHAIGPVDLAPFFIDTTEVTNAQYKAFLDETGYQPGQSTNFLKHWPDGKMPASLADYPVVYVDIDDARAYAEWAGKRLPTEYEWQLAAQGPDGRTWPWGEEFDEKYVNTSGALMPVFSIPEGQSPYGCYHMSGNAYEITESVRDDGHTRFLILRGGSYYDPNLQPDTASVWYVDGGPRPCTHHAKQILLWPGLDRCATVGFRCVKDATE